MTSPATWRIGDTTITSIVEAETRHVPVEAFYPEASAADVQASLPWLPAGMADDDGSAITFRVQAFVLRHAGRTILVDPCVGNGKHLKMPFWNGLDLPWLDELRACGVEPADVDLVVHTHLHEDHIGWDTHCVEGEWRPTFPNARHLYVGDELEWASSEERRARDPGPFAESIEPILTAGLGDEVAADHDLGDGLRFVSTPGHTPGHVSLEIVTSAETLVITGDLLHHPFQFAAPDVPEIGDSDADLARRTRKDFFAEHARSGAVIAGTHFPVDPVGRILVDGAAWRFEPTPR
ncbi:MAG: MBL fold metallo-hydrolase [Acidimicrobiales bacterium]|nr:MAG: MBL fold metallo-hydrolase [Acidimicrobiales bacterium]